MSKKTIVALFMLIVVAGAGFIYFNRRGTPENPRNTSNSWIMDKPTIEYEKPREDYGKMQWWAWMGYAYTKDNEEILLNTNIYADATLLFGNSYTLDGIIYTFDFTRMRWDKGANILNGSMKRASDGVVGSWKLKFPQNGYRVYEQEIQEETLRIELRNHAVPLWAARTEDEMLQIGWRGDIPVYGGGFHDTVDIRVTLTNEMETKIFNGQGNYARVWKGPVGQQQGEAAVGFIYQQPEFYINYHYLRNPYDLNEDFIKQGRIGFPDNAYRFDNFVYQDSGSETLDWFRLDGTYDAGEVHLTGEKITMLHDRQKHHPLIRWTGTITWNGQTINVNSLGSGELRLIEET